MKNQNTNTIEGFDGEMLHPSLDIKDGILILGFRYRAKTREEKELFVVVHGDGVVDLKEGDPFEIESKSYFLEQKSRKLIRIEERWGLLELQKFVHEYLEGGQLAEPGLRELFESVRGLVRKYVELEREVDYSLVSAWIVGTYFFPIFSAYPFLNPKAPKMSGKSQLLSLLRQLCFNASKDFPSLAALGDTVDALRGTYLIDQADYLTKHWNEQLLNILTDSYKKGGGKRRVLNIEKGRRTLLEFETYSPKALASVRDLPEDLRDRFLMIPLLRSMKNFPDPNDEEGEGWKDERGKIYRFLICNYKVVCSVYSVLKVQYRQNPGVYGRTLELWLPLETILQVLGVSEEERKEAKKRFLAQYQFTEYEPSELEEAVVKTILELFPEGEEQVVLSPKGISEYIGMDVFPAGESLQKRATRVGWALKNLNLSSGKKRTKDGVCYQFERAKVESIHTRSFGVEPTSPTPADSEGLNIEQIPV